MTTALRCFLALLIGSHAAGLACAANGEPDIANAPDRELAELLQERLSWMKPVAAWKWAHERPIEDRQREALVIQRSTEAALRHGLVVETSEVLFRAQIEAAKEIQRYWHDRWRESGENPPQVVDLNQTIRPQLLRLGDAITETAARLTESKTVGAVTLADQLTIEGLLPGSARAIADAVAGLARYDNRLDQILLSGVLRVGTTGDYLPFSFRESDDAPFRGTDIDQAHDLADALGVELRLVQTTWPSLMDDLAKGLFDVGMSGISLTLERQRQAFFSTPYHVGGKAAISRCEDVERFDTLPEIDQPATRVIVNPGGTNERFVDGRLRQSQKLLHPDNRTIFVEIMEDRADVMITDRIEADWQAEREPELCVASQDNFTFQQKAYLLPRDTALKQFVDAWLAQRAGERSVGAAYRH